MAPLRIFGVNCAGIKSKLDSFEDILSRINPQIWTIQETKLKPNENLKSDLAKKYQIYTLSRIESEGGGLAIGVHNDIESTLVKEGDDKKEAIVVQVEIGKQIVRIIVGYGPQENASKEKKEAFWKFLEEESIKTELLGHGLIIQMDGNVHGGPTLIKNDPNNQNINGRLFEQFLDRNSNLIVANNLNLCEGNITRIRNLKNKTENAILDFLIVNEKMLPFLKKMVIDEDRKFCLSNYAQYKINKRVIETDHNAIIAEFSLSIPKRKSERIELFNLRNKRCQALFTEETRRNSQLVNCFKNQYPFEVQCKMWLKTFNTVLYKCFKKIRIVKDDKKNELKRNLIKEHNNLKIEVKNSEITNEMKKQIEQRIVQIEEEVADKIANDYVGEIIETLRKIGGDEKNLNGSGRNKVWELLKNKFPKSKAAVPVGKRDTSGMIVTNHEKLKSLYLNTYKHRLRNRPIKEDFQSIKEHKEELFKLRIKLASSNKSEPWSMTQLENVLKSLKEGKSRDPNGWVRDLFMNDVAGEQLKISLLMMMNKMKAKNYIPDFIRNADVTTIYKGKGDKFDLENDRGIFLVSTFRSIMMKLIYVDKYNTIEQNMSDSQVGGRKGKNVRNHIWVLNGIISEVITTKKKPPIDIQIFDYKQCFDSLWMEECLNDLYESGVKDDKLALLHNINNKVKIAVKTPVGKSRREDIFEAITQGDVFAPILCSNQVDTFGRECLQEGKYTYLYKGEVEIPPLGMVDDLLCVSECGPVTSMLNGYINCKTSSKKLMFGVEKCKKLHVGNKNFDFKCQNLLVDKWTEIEIKGEDLQETSYKDVYDGQHMIEQKEEEKYLGDIVSIDGRNIKNIKARINKGVGIVNRIMTMVNGIPFGRQYFQVGIILRNCLLASSMLFNSEAWYNVTKSELDLLESIDLSLLRQLLNAPKGTPKEMIYLELGILPFRELVRGRRLTFLHEILNEERNSMVYKFLEAQLKNKKKKDWVNMVFEDLKYLELDNLTMEAIQGMKNQSFRKLIKQKIEEKEMERMETLKKSHSKVQKIEHNGLVMQKYLQPNSTKISKEEAQLIFKLRCRVTSIKANMKGSFESLQCRACKLFEESQEHIVNHCKILNKEEKILEYEKIFNGTVIEKVEIAKRFQKKFEKLEKMID